ncbi:MAG TPA: hypothetical protein VK488_15315 [Gaiellaceae bacterium]|nr:hypothetical protein [Gaiellaceae bacterium]
MSTVLHRCAGEAAVEDLTLIHLNLSFADLSSLLDDATATFPGTALGEDELILGAG